MQLAMEFELYQYILIAIVFIWSGFVRSGLGFGGALFTIPFLLLIQDEMLQTMVDLKQDLEPSVVLKNY